jgi:hypothetical protein
MEIGKQYTLRILKRNGISLQKPILFIGECFNIEKDYIEFIDINTQNVRIVDNTSQKGGRRSKRTKIK